MLLSFFINLVFHWEFLAAAGVALALHFILDISIWFTVGILALWVAVALAITLVLSWASSSASQPTPQKKNVNPYSKKTSDFIKNPCTEIPKEDEVCEGSVEIIDKGEE